MPAKKMDSINIKLSQNKDFYVLEGESKYDLRAIKQTMLKYERQLEFDVDNRPSI